MSEEMGHLRAGCILISSPGCSNSACAETPETLKTKTQNKTPKTIGLRYSNSEIQNGAVYLFHDSIYWTCPEQTNIKKKKVDEWYPRAGGRRNGR